MNKFGGINKTNKKENEQAAITFNGKRVEIERR